jgi:hypothetical protein
MKVTVFFLRIFFLSLLCGQGALYGLQQVEASAPPLDEGPADVEQQFARQFIEWPNIENGRETFGGRLTSIKDKNEMAFMVLKEELKQLGNEFGFISRVTADALVGGVFNKMMYVKWSDIDNGLETFGNKLPYIRSKTKKTYDALLGDLRKLNAGDGYIVRDQSNKLVDELYNQIAYMPCADIDKPGSPVYNKLSYIQGKDLASYNEVITQLKSDNYCKNGRIARDVVETRVHAVYVRVYVAWISAAGFYYTKRFAQTTYNWLTTSLIPALSYAFSTGYDYVKQYSAHVLEKNRQAKEIRQARQVYQTERQGQALLPTVPPVIQEQEVLVKQPVIEYIQKPLPAQPQRGKRIRFDPTR